MSLIQVSLSFNRDLPHPLRARQGSWQEGWVSEQDRNTFPWSSRLEMLAYAMGLLRMSMGTTAGGGWTGV